MLGLGLAAVLTLAACGSAPASPSPATSPPSSPSAAAGSPSPTPNDHGAPALEARLADKIGGTTMSKLSLTGADFLAIGPEAGRTQLQALLQQLGHTTVDLQVAESYDPTGSQAAKEAIFEVKGADPVRLLALWVSAQQAATANRTVVTNATIGGRTLTRLEDQSQAPAAVSYVVASGDALFIVATTDESLVLEVVGKIGPS
jgi:hypothetical protein